MEDRQIDRERDTERQTETDRQTGKQTVRQTDRHIHACIPTNTATERQIDKHREVWSEFSSRI